MRRVIFSPLSDHHSQFGRPMFWLLFGLVAALPAPGCRHEAESHAPSVTKPQTVRLIQPQVRNIVRVVGQPSFIQSYERISVYPKMNAYIKKWNVDIGDRVKKGDVLATLFVPELVEDHGTKKATVVLDRERVTLANVVVEVAQADVDAALARVEEARAELDGPGPRPSAGSRKPSGSTMSSRGAWSIPRMSSRRPIGGRRPSPCATRRWRPC